MEKELPSPAVPAKKPSRKFPIEELFKAPLKIPRVLDLIPQNGFHGGPGARRKGYQLAAWSLLASVIDGLILISLTCVFVLACNFMMKGARTEESFLQLFAEVFALCCWVYMVTLRVLLGSSVGEWACDLRLGQPHERLAKFYPLRIILRANLVLLTGLVVLPLLSLLCGRDIPGILSGIRLLSLK